MTEQSTSTPSPDPLAALREQWQAYYRDWCDCLLAQNWERAMAMARGITELNRQIDALTLSEAAQTTEGPR